MTGVGSRDSNLLLQLSVCVCVCVCWVMTYSYSEDKIVSETLPSAITALLIKYTSILQSELQHLFRELNQPIFMNTFCCVWHSPCTELTSPACLLSLVSDKRGKSIYIKANLTGRYCILGQKELQRTHCLCPRFLV